MDVLPAVVAWLGPPEIIVAGILGGITRWLTLREKFRDGVISVVVGLLAARYLDKYVAAFLDLSFRWIDTPKEMGEVSAYLAGLSGVSIAGVVVGFASAMRREKTNASE